MIIQGMNQGSEAWKQARLGCLTASRISEALTKTKSGWGSSRENLMGSLIAERLTGIPMESYTSTEMIWGTEHEAEAVAAYEFYVGGEIQECGFIPHPRIAMSGASPDRFVGEEGLLEVKAPLTKTHIDTLLSRSIPKKYELQMLFQMACTGRKWNDFLSFDPRMPESLRLFRRRLYRDEDKILEIETEVTTFLVELVTKIKDLEALNGQTAQVA